MDHVFESFYLARERIPRINGIATIQMKRKKDVKEAGNVQESIL